MVIVEIDPIDKLNELIELLSKDFELIVHEGPLPELYLGECETEIEIVNPMGENVSLRLGGEFTFYYPNGHQHYFYYQDEYEMMLEDFRAYVRGDACGINTYVDGEWVGGGFIMLKGEEAMDPWELEDYFTSKYPSGQMSVTIRLWDSKRDETRVIRKK